MYPPAGQHSSGFHLCLLLLFLWVSVSVIKVSFAFPSSLCFSTLFPFIAIFLSAFFFVWCSSCEFKQSQKCNQGNSRPVFCPTASSPPKLKVIKKLPLFHPVSSLIYVGFVDVLKQLTVNCLCSVAVRLHSHMLQHHPHTFSCSATL